MWIQSISIKINPNPSLSDLKLVDDLKPQRCVEHATKPLCTPDPMLHSRHVAHAAVATSALSTFCVRLKTRGPSRLRINEIVLGVLKFTTYKTESVSPASLGHCYTRTAVDVLTR
jgi:hypothetical protein